VHADHILRPAVTEFAKYRLTPRCETPVWVLHKRVDSRAGISLRSGIRHCSVSMPASALARCKGDKALVPAVNPYRRVAYALLWRLAITYFHAWKLHRIQWTYGFILTDRMAQTAACAEPRAVRFSQSRSGFRGSSGPEPPGHHRNCHTTIDGIRAVAAGQACDHG
jgi:hypothetical protein